MASSFPLPTPYYTQGSDVPRLHSIRDCSWQPGRNRYHPNCPLLHTYKNTPDFSIMEIIEKTPTLKVILEMYSECDQKSVNWRLIPHTITYTLLIGNDKIKVQAENMAA